MSRLPTLTATGTLARLVQPLPGRSTPFELVRIMARREALRLLPGLRPGGDLALGLGMAMAAALLIPLHRAYGDEALRGRSYFLLFAVGLQTAFLLLAGRAVWAGMRRDAATGSREELLLTGAGTQSLLLGKWVGTSLAAAGWSLLLLPALLLAAAFTGTPLLHLVAMLPAWGLTAALGALAGAALSLSERNPAQSGGQLFLVFQFWLMARFLVPRAASALGPFGSWAAGLLADLDPITLVPAIMGGVHEAWPLKMLVLLLALIGGGIWLSGVDVDTSPSSATARARDAGDLFSLRPIRAWIVSTAAERPAAEYGRYVMFAFERVHGWRLRVSPMTWFFVLALGVLPTIPLAILGPDGNTGMIALSVGETGVATLIATLGVAAALACEREQGRWVFLACSPLSRAEIVLAKWFAAWWETWPLWVTGLLRPLLAAAAGALPWSAVPVATVAAPLAAASGAGLAAAFCLRAPTLTAAQQRALLIVLAPVTTVTLALWLLPHLTELGYLSPAHLLISALRFHPGFAPPRSALLAFALNAIGGATALWLATRTRFVS